MHTTAVPRLRPVEAWRRSTLIFRLAVRADWAGLSKLVLLTLLAGVLPVAGAWVTTALLDSIVAGAGPATSGLALQLAIIGVVAAVLPFRIQYINAEFDRRIGYHCQAQLFDAVNGFGGLERLENPRFHDIVGMAQSASRMAPSQSIDAILRTIQAVLTMSGFLATLVSLNPWLAIVVVAAVIPLMPTEISLSRRRVGREELLSRIQRREGFYEGLLTRLDAAKEVRLFRLGGYFRDRMLNELRSANDIYRRLERNHYLTRGAMAVLGALAAGTGIVWLVAGGRGGGLTVGEVTLFIAAAAGVHLGAQTISGGVGQLHELLLLMQHYETVVGAESDLPRHEGLLVPANPERGIEFHDVWFRYAPDLPWVLRGVSFAVPVDAAVGLVGVNGAGKSTVVKLLCRFYDPNRGSITWNGIDLRAFDVEVLRERISAVFQDFVCYDLTAQENIAIGDLNALADRERVARAANLAGVHTAVESLPNGYQTLLSRVYFDNADRDDVSTGVVLSGGQWQRLALARAFLRDCRDLLILDEPSSGLDAEAEYEIHERLRRLRDGRSSLLISHRLNAIRDADHILVLDGGRVVERGTHDELMHARGRYARLFSLQAAGYRDGRQAVAAGDPEPSEVPAWHR